MSDVITLRTGREVPRFLVTPVMISLRDLLDENPVALIELIELARDPAHALFGKTGQALAELHLIDGSGKLHDATRDVILAASEGDGFDVRLVSPFAAGAA